jgi:hypothetical protein
VIDIGPPRRMSSTQAAWTVVMDDEHNEIGQGADFTLDFDEDEEVDGLGWLIARFHDKAQVDRAFSGCL